MTHVGKRRGHTATILFFSLITLALIGSLILSVMYGARDVSAQTVVEALLNADLSTTDHAAASKRLPRTILALIIGASLATSGMSIQAVTRNPLADPGILGVLSGASLFVVIGLAFFNLNGQLPTMLVAILGSACTAVFVYFIGSLGHAGPTPLKLALAGAATSAALTSITSAILLPRIQLMEVFRFWQIGGVGKAEWSALSISLPLLLIGFLLAAVTTSGMNALALGDDIAQSLGINVGLQRGIAALAAVILAGVATSLAGPIGFLGLVVPHFCRLIVGTNHRILLPACILTGATLLTLADTLGRVIARPSEIAVGVLLPIIGAPVFIWIVRRQKVREL